MQEKTIHIPFNREHYINNQKVIWDLMYKEVSSSYYIYIAATVIVLAIGLAVDLKGGFPITTIIGTGMLISILLKFRHVRKVKRNFFARANDIAAQHESALSDTTYIFTTDTLTVQNNRQTKQYNGDDLEPLVYFENTLILKVKKGESEYITISQYEVSHADFDEIHNILNKWVVTV